LETKRSRYTSAEGASIDAPNGRRRRGGGMWGGDTPSPLGVWGPQNFFFFLFLELKIASFVAFWVLFFVSSSSTDGLLWDDLSGSIAKGNRENPQDPNGRSCFLTCRPTNRQSFPNWQWQQTCLQNFIWWRWCGWCAGICCQIKELQTVQPILPLSPQIFDFGKTCNMANYWAFTRYDRRTDWSARPRLGPTGRSDQSDRPVGQTVAEPPTSVNQINVAC